VRTIRTPRFIGSRHISCESALNVLKLVCMRLKLLRYACYLHDICTVKAKVLLLKMYKHYLLVGMRKRAHMDCGAGLGFVIKRANRSTCNFSCISSQTKHRQTLKYPSQLRQCERDIEDCCPYSKQCCEDKCSLFFHSPGSPIHEHVVFRGSQKGEAV
jgi:hypothetical protein